MGQRRGTGVAAAIRPVLQGDTLGERIAYALATTPESLAKVARACDVGWLTAKRWASEEAVPQVHNLIDLADALNTTAGQLIGHYPDNDGWLAFYKKRKRELDARMIENLKSVAFAGIKATPEAYEDLYLALRRAADVSDEV